MPGASSNHALQTAGFLGAFLEDWEPLVAGREGRKMVELFQVIYQSGSQGRPVRFLAPV